LSHFDTSIVDKYYLLLKCPVLLDQNNRHHPTFSISFSRLRMALKWRFSAKRTNKISKMSNDKKIIR
jgi:hypothetical protein